MSNYRTLISWFLIAAAPSYAAVCETRPIPADLPPVLRRIVEEEAAMNADTVQSSKAKRVGLVLPAATLSGIGVPAHPALAALLRRRPLQLESSPLASRRRVAGVAARRIAQEINGLEQENGPLAPIAQDWIALDAGSRTGQIAIDVADMVAGLGWWSAPNLFLEISAQLEISPLRLEPFLGAIIWTDAQNIPFAVVVREKASGDLRTWFTVRTSDSEVTVLKRLSFQGNSRFDTYAKCRPTGV